MVRNNERMQCQQHSWSILQVLCWGGTTLDPIRRQSTLAKYSKSGKRDVPEFWKRAAQDALRVADWAGRPQIRTLQAICLLLNWPTSGSLSQVSDSVCE